MCHAMPRHNATKPRRNARARLGSYDAINGIIRMSVCTIYEYFIEYRAAAHLILLSSSDYMPTRFKYVFKYITLRDARAFWRKLSNTCISTFALDNFPIFYVYLCMYIYDYVIYVRTPYPGRLVRTTESGNKMRPVDEEPKIVSSFLYDDQVSITVSTF